MVLQVAYYTRTLPYANNSQFFFRKTVSETILGRIGLGLLQFRLSLGWNDHHFSISVVFDVFCSDGTCIAHRHAGKCLPRHHKLPLFFLDYFFDSLVVLLLELRVRGKEVHGVMNLIRFFIFNSRDFDGWLSLTHLALGLVEFPAFSRLIFGIYWNIRWKLSQ